MFQKQYTKFILLEQVQGFFLSNYWTEKNNLTPSVNQQSVIIEAMNHNNKIKYTTTIWRNIINIKKYSDINKVLYILHTSSNIIILKINKIFYNVKLIVRNILKGLFSRLVESSCLGSKTVLPMVNQSSNKRNYPGKDVNWKIELKTILHMNLFSYFQW